MVVRWRTDSFPYAKLFEDTEYHAYGVYTDFVRHEGTYGYGINVAAIQKLLNQQNKKKSVERGEKDRES